MKSLFRLIALGGIFWVASYLFPEAVQIGTLQALALATLLFLIINAIVMFVFSLIVALFYVIANKKTYTSKEPRVLAKSSVLISSLLSVPITILLLNVIVRDFKVVGFIPMLLLTICISMCVGPDYDSLSERKSLSDE